MFKNKVLIKPAYITLKLINADARVPWVQAVAIKTKYIAEIQINLFSTPKPLSITKVMVPKRMSANNVPTIEETEKVNVCFKILFIKNYIYRGFRQLVEMYWVIYLFKSNGWDKPLETRPAYPKLLCAHGGFKSALVLCSASRFLRYTNQRPKCFIYLFFGREHLCHIRA